MTEVKYNNYILLWSLLTLNQIYILNFFQFYIRQVYSILQKKKIIIEVKSPGYLLFSSDDLLLLQNQKNVREKRIHELCSPPIIVKSKMCRKGNTSYFRLLQIWYPSKDKTWTNIMFNRYLVVSQWLRQCKVKCYKTVLYIILLHKALFYIYYTLPTSFLYSETCLNRTLNKPESCVNKTLNNRTLNKPESCVNKTFK